MKTDSETVEDERRERMMAAEAAVLEQIEIAQQIIQNLSVHQGPVSEPTRAAILNAVALRYHSLNS